MKVYSSISSEIKNLKLKKGLLFSLPAIFLLLFFGTFAPLDMVEKYGKGVFFLSIFSIAIGMIPYRKATRLEASPHVLSVKDSLLEFKYLGKLALRVPLNDIQEISFFEKKTFFGIALHLHTSQNIKSESFAIRRYQRKCKKKLSCDLFLPYFPEKTKKFLAAQCHASLQDPKDSPLPLQEE